MQERFEVNKNKVDVLHVTTPFSSNGGEDDSDAFCSRMEKPLCKLTGFPHGVAERDYVPTKDVVSGSVRLPSADRIPPYTTWIFLDRQVLLCNYYISFEFSCVCFVCMAVGVSQ